MVLPTSPPASMSVSQILAEFGITAGTTKRISNDLFPLVGGTAGSTCLLGASFSGKSAGRYSTIRGTSNDAGRSITVDSAGNIYVTGSYQSTATVPINTFGAAPTASGVSLPASVGGTDVFIIKWKPDGSLAGYTTFSGTSGDIGYGIAVDSSQNIYVTGNYSSTTTVPIKTFGTAPTASGVSLPASTGIDVFVVKWNGSNGTLAGYSTIKGTGTTDIGYGIAVDSSQNIYVTGQYNSTAVTINTFGTAPTASGVSLPASTGTDVFIIKWNGSNGTLAGYSTIRGTASLDTGRSIAVDSNQNIYVTGNYSATATVPINTFGTAPTASGVSLPITPGTTRDAFVIKWNANGTVAGYSTIRGTANDIGYGIAVVSAGNIYVTGTYNSTETVPINTFGTAPAASGVSMPSSTGTDVFVVKWNGSNGTLAGYTTLSTGGVDIGHGIAVDSSQNIYITGGYMSTAAPIKTFGTAPTASGVSLPAGVSGSTSSTFVIKWNGSNGTLAGYSTSRGGASTDTGYAIAVDSSRNIYITGQYTSTTATVPINTFGMTPVESGFSMPITLGTDAFVIKWNA